MTNQERFELHALRDEVAALRQQVKDLESAVASLRGAMMFWQVMPIARSLELPFSPLPPPLNPPWFAPQIEQPPESVGEVYCHR